MQFLHGGIAFEFICELGKNGWEFRLCLPGKPGQLVMWAELGGEVGIKPAAPTLVPPDVLPSLEVAFEEKFREAESLFRKSSKPLPG